MAIAANVLQFSGESEQQPLLNLAPPPKGVLLTPNTRFSFSNTNLPVEPDGTSRLSRCPQRLNLRQTGWLIRLM